jgi:hypothetical protein
MGLLALERARAQQRSRMINIKHDGTNTKLFYLRANGRKRKKQIQILQTMQGLAITHDDKEQEIARHFKELLRAKHHRSLSLKWEELNYPTFNLSDLEVDITGEEFRNAIS